MISFSGWQSVDIKKFCITVRSKGAVMLRDLKLANSVPPWYSRLEPKPF